VFPEATQRENSLTRHTRREQIACLETALHDNGADFASAGCACECGTGVGCGFTRLQRPGPARACRLVALAGPEKRVFRRRQH
jgi:hypothetical protein